MRTLFLFYSILLTTLAIAAPGKSTPNILFISIDDFNDWGPSQMDGEPFDVDTPNFDKFAAESILFTNAHCNAPSCNPSRTSIMSGLHPTSTGVYANSNDWRTNEVFENILLLPEYFHNHGYTTLGCGKIYHANQGTEKDRQGYLSPRGWDQYFPSFDAQLPVQSMPDVLPNRGEGKFDWGGTGKPIEDMGDNKVVNWAIEQMNKPRANPLFLAVGIYRPHMPWYVPDEYYDRYDDEKITPPTNPDGWDKNIPKALLRNTRRFTEFTGRPGPSHGYASCMTYADFELGRLLDAFRKSPIAENTVIVLWTDHGWHLGEKGHFSKFTLWEESTRVPLVLSYPGAGSRQVDTAVSLMDVYPTLVALAGLPANKDNDGQSLLSVIESPANANRAILTSLAQNYHAVRDGRYRYIKSLMAEALFDHSTDPREFNHIADQPGSKQIIERLSKSIPANPHPQMGKE